MREAATAGRLAGDGLLERALTFASFARHGARVAAKTIYLRVRLPRWVDERELPALLAALDAHGERDRAPLSARDAELADVVVRKLLYAPKLKTTCLYRSLIRYSVLRREAAMPVEFVMGVRPLEAGEFTAHAWIELDGRPLWEKLEHEYQTTYRFPEGGAR